jgi:hypothetical protein
MIADAPTNEAVHPSFLALDRAHLGLASPAVVAHLASCGACRSYVESPASAAGASDFAALQRAIDGRSQPRSKWLWAAASFAAMVCALLLVVTHHAPDARPGADGYVGAKGFRSVWIYVKRGSETVLWDGKRPLLPGDRLRLKIDPGSYHRLAVYSLSEPPTLLYSGRLIPGQNLTLPDAWQIDDSLSDEQLLVVFSDHPVEPEWDDWRLGRVPPGVAALPFTLRKVGSDAGPFGP